MSRAAIPVKRAALAMTVAGGLIAGAGIILRLADPAPPTQAAISHAMMGQGAHHLEPQPEAAMVNEVVINNFSFVPTMLTVAAGTKVVWTNDDADPHIVTSETDPKVFKSPPLDTGESFAFTFDKPGTYRYFCSLHPHMRGTIVVQ
jgi:plastocyanin